MHNGMVGKSRMGAWSETKDQNAWYRLIGLIAVALLLTAVVAYRAIGASSLHGRLAVPPLYDDISYFTAAVRWMNAAGSQSLLASVWDLLHHHAPFSTLVAAIGFWLFPGSYVGPYLVNAVFVFAFLLGIIWLTWGRPFLEIATCLIATACVPTVWHTVTEARPDLPWGLAIGIAIGAVVRRHVLQDKPRNLVLLGAGCGLAASVKPTAFPASFALLGSVFAVRLLLDCVQAGRLRTLLPRVVAALLWFGLGLLAITGLLLGPSLISTINYILNAFVTQRDLWSGHEGFWVGLQYFLVGPGGQAALNFWLWVGLSLMAIRLLLALRFGPAARSDAIIMLVAVVIAYAIPSLTEVKSYFFGAIFYGIFMVAMALNFSAIQVSAENYLGAKPLSTARQRRLLGHCVRALPFVATVVLFVKMVVIGPVSLALWLNDQQQDDIRIATERVWKLVREFKSDGSSGLTVGFSAPYPVTPGTIELYGLQARIDLSIRPELFHRTLDEMEKAMLATDLLVVSSSMPHNLIAPRMGDELIQRLDANKDVCLLDSLKVPDVRVRIYRHPC